jgi:hypothetical protein
MTLGARRHRLAAAGMAASYSSSPYRRRLNDVLEPLDPAGSPVAAAKAP